MGALPALRSDPIAVFRPGLIDPEERELRERLQLARDISTAKLSRLGSGQAAALHFLVLETATAWVFASASKEQLADVVRQCRRLLNAASAALLLERGMHERYPAS